MMGMPPVPCNSLWSSAPRGTKAHLSTQCAASCWRRARTTSITAVKGEEILVVDLEDLHRKLGARTDYKKWFARRTTDCGLVEDRDFGTIVSRNLPGQAGRPSKRHIVTLEAAKQIAMLERNALGDAIRTYFIRCEERLHVVAPAAAAEETRRLQEAISAIPGDAAPPTPRAVPPNASETTLLDMLGRSMALTMALTAELIAYAKQTRPGPMPLAARTLADAPRKTAPDAPANARPEPFEDREPEETESVVELLEDEPELASSPSSASPASSAREDPTSADAPSAPAKPKQILPKGGGHRKNPPVVPAWTWLIGRTQARRQAEAEAAAKPRLLSPEMEKAIKDLDRILWPEGRKTKTS